MQIIDRHARKNYIVKGKELTKIGHANAGHARNDHAHESYNQLVNTREGHDRNDKTHEIICKS